MNERISASVDDLLKLVLSAVTGNDLQLPVAALKSPGANTAGEDFLPGAMLRMKDIAPASGIVRTPDGMGIQIGPATGVDAPFSGLSCLLRLFLTGDAADPVGFTISGSPNGGWTLADAFPTFGSLDTPVLTLRADGQIPVLTLQSQVAGGDTSRPKGLSLSGFVDLSGASAGIAALLGVPSLRIDGSFDLRRRGSRLWDFKLAAHSPLKVNLGLATVELNVALGMHLVYDPPNRCFGARPAFYFTADFPFTAGGVQHTVPLTAEILSFDEPISCEIDLSGVATAALDEIAQLIPTPSGTPPDIKELLPLQIADNIVDAVNPTKLRILLDPTATHPLSSVKLDMVPSASWHLFGEVIADIDQLSVLADDPMGGGGIALTVKGSFTIGTDGQVCITASTIGGFNVQGYLADNAHLALGDIPNFPDGTETALGGLTVQQLRFEWAPSGYAFYLVLEDSWPFDFGCAQVAIEAIELSVDATVEPQTIDLSGRIAVAGFPLSLSANRGDDGAWTFYGSTVDTLPMGQVLGWLQLFLPVQLPLPVDGVSLAGVSAGLRIAPDMTAVGLDASLQVGSSSWATLGLFACKSTADWTYALTVQLDKTLDLEGVDVVGPALSGNNVSGIQVTYASGVLTPAEKSLMGQLIPAGPLPFDNAPAGLSFSATVSIEGTPTLLSRDLTQPQGAPPAPVPDPTPPAPGTGGYSNTAPPATDATLWKVLDRTFGVAHLGRIGLRYSNDRVYLMLDAELRAGPILFGLDGLGIGLRPNDLHPTPTLDGLEAGFDSAGIALSGALINAAGQYTGTLKVEVAGYTIDAIGAYAMHAGAPTFFAYAILRNRPLGGPPFFFVTGLAAGLGYNRRLVIPTIDQVPQFPLILAALPGDGGPLVQAGGDPLATLDAFGPDWISMSPGDNWLAAGVSFSSFEMIQSTAVLTLTSGPKALLSLVGLSNLSIPTGSQDPIANAQVALLAVLDPERGDLAVDGKLTPASYVFSPQSRLSGGFAFYMWFTTGDFVVTFGGYHPHFQKPAAYPAVPRLQMNWQVSDHLAVVASEYFALTPSAIMAGGALSAMWSSGSLSAWFDVEANFLLLWKPFSYSIDASINIGASFELDLLFCSVTVTIHVGVDLSIWGPPFGGTATVDLDIISFSIDFGADRPYAPKLMLQEFIDAFLPHPPSSNSAAVMCSVHVANGLVKTMPAPTNDADPEPIACIINPQQLGISVRCAVPLLGVTFANPHGLLIDPHTGPDPTAGLGIAPVGCASGDWASGLLLTISRAGDTDGSDQYKSLRFVAVRAAAPKALWGISDIGDSTQAGAALTPEQTVTDVLFGVHISANQGTPDFTQKVSIQTLLYDSIGCTVAMANTPLAPPRAAPQSPVPDSIAEACLRGAAVLEALQRRGQGIGLQPGTINVNELAAGNGRLLALPIEQEIA